MLETTASFVIPGKPGKGWDMRWYRKLYTGPNAEHNISMIREKADAGFGMVSVYYITLSSTPGNLLDIFHNGMLKNPLFAENQCKDVVGVAQGKQEACRLAGTILLDLYSRTGGFDIRSFFKDQDFKAD